MPPPKNPTACAQQFARAIIAKRWADLLPLCTMGLQTQHSVATLTTAFGWPTLGPRLRQMYLDMTGEPEEMVPMIDPPRRFEVFEVVEREPPPNLAPGLPVQWFEVQFLPAEDSEFDTCCSCFLAIVEEDGPRVAAFAIELDND